MDLPLGDGSVPPEIWEWRFPLLLDGSAGDGQLENPPGPGAWPLLLRHPGGRAAAEPLRDKFVQRLEIKANAAFLANHRLRLNGRVLPSATAGLGLRYRHSSLYPRDPCIEPTCPAVGH